MYNIATIASVSIALFFIPKIVGIVLSIPLLIHQFDHRSGFLKSLCDTNSSQSRVNCNSVLESPGASVFGLITWSEIGLIYFITSFLYLIIAPPNQWAITFVLAIISAVYIPYSIGYQSLVVKKWCKVCLLVQITLFFDFLICLYNLNNIVIKDPNWSAQILLFALLTAAVSTMYSLLIPVFKTISLVKYEYPAARKIKLAREVFDLQLKKQKKIITAPQYPIILTSNSNDLILTIVSNPTCSKCRDIHSELESIIKSTTSLSVQVIFLPDKEIESASRRITELLVSNHLSFGSETFFLMMHEYFAKYFFNRIVWLAKHIEMNWHKSSTSAATRICDEHINWCKQNRIASTPVVFLNGHLLPDGYNLRDLKIIFD